MNVLGFETSSDEGSVALRVGESVSEEIIPRPRQQTDRLLPLALELLAAAKLRIADLDGIAFGRGPGSFTGVRIAAAVAQGLGVASGLPLAPVSSLAAMAQGLSRRHGVASALICVDARMGEVFWARFELRDGIARAVGEERLSAPEAVSAVGLEGWAAAGDGFSAFAPVLAPLLETATGVFPDARPRASDLFAQALADLAAGQGRGPEEALPVYLRSEAAWEKLT